MHANGPRPFSSLPSAVADRLGAACDRFKAACRAGAVPPIDDYLTDVPEEERPALRRELQRLASAYPAPVGDPGGEALTVPDVERGSPAPPRPWANPEYELLEELGRGGMGVVYRAVQRRAGRVVALKLIRGDLLAGDEEERRNVLERFRREAQAAARVEHDHVVTVYDVGETEGVPYYTMRYVPGRSLAEALRDGPLEGRAAAGLLEPVARAVQAAHAHGLLHRDLKPANVLVDGAGRPYVSDFGLVKWQEAAAGMTHPGTCLGTPSYMAPEQAEDAASATAASDVYSLGATLYAVVTGRPPFQAATPAETLHQLRYREPAVPRSLNPAIDRDLETIILKCLRKEPAGRYATAGELADDLARYRAGAPIRARPVPAWERAWRWGRRNPTLALTGVVAGVALVAAAVISALYAIASDRHNTELTEANSRLAAVNADLVRERDRATTAADRLKEAHGQMVRGARGLMSVVLPQGQLRLKPGQLDAEAMARVTVEAGRLAVKAAPKDAGLRAELADSCYLLGTVYREKGQWEKMKAAWREAVRELEETTRLAPQDGSARFRLGRTCYNLGVRAEQESDLAGVVAWQARALTHLEPLDRNDKVRWFICWAHVGRGTALLKQEQPAQALPDWECALELADAGDREAIRLHGLAYALARLGRHKEAAVGAEQALRGLPHNADNCKAAAAVFALAARDQGKAGTAVERERLARRAVECLNEARTHGAFRAAGAAAAVANGADFEALRERDDFRKFLREASGK